MEYTFHGQIGVISYRLYIFWVCIDLLSNHHFQYFQEVGPKDLTSKSHMKVVLRWMREKKKLRLVCNRIGAHKQFLYTIPATTGTVPSKQKPS